MEIKASSIYDKKTVTAFSKQTVNKLKPVYIILFILICFIFIVNLYGVIALDQSISTLITPVLLATFLLLLYYFVPQLNYILQKTKTDIVNEYIIYDTKFIEISTAKGLKSTCEVEFSSLNKVLETKSYIYMYIAKDKAMIIDKSTITNGCVEDFRSAVISQIGIENYKIKI